VVVRDINRLNFLELAQNGRKLMLPDWLVSKSKFGSIFCPVIVIFSGQAGFGTTSIRTLRGVSDHIQSLGKCKAIIPIHHAQPVVIRPGQWTVIDELVLHSARRFASSFQCSYRLEFFEICTAFNDEFLAIFLPGRFPGERYILLGFFSFEIGEVNGEDDG
jgi:hypothetical protein